MSVVLHNYCSTNLLPEDAYHKTDTSKCNAWSRNGSMKGRKQLFTVTNSTRELQKERDVGEKFHCSFTHTQTDKASFISSTGFTSHRWYFPSKVLQKWLQTGKWNWVHVGANTGAYPPLTSLCLGAANGSVSIAIVLSPDVHWWFSVHKRVLQDDFGNIFVID